jgi:hypothetical protein
MISKKSKMLVAISNKYFFQGRASGRSLTRLARSVLRCPRYLYSLAFKFEWNWRESPVFKVPRSVLPILMSVVSTRLRIYSVSCCEWDEGRRDAAEKLREIREAAR